MTCTKYLGNKSNIGVNNLEWKETEIWVSVTVENCEKSVTCNSGEQGIFLYYWLCSHLDSSLFMWQKGRKSGWNWLQPQHFILGSGTTLNTFLASAYDASEQLIDMYDESMLLCITWVLSCWDELKYLIRGLILSHGSG